MPEPLFVRADVIDIGLDGPRNQDAFFVDTNVWLWFSYTRASQVPATRSPNATHYPSYLDSTLKAGAALYRTGITCAEFATIVESSEREIFNRTYKPGNNVSKKDFRRDRAQRRQVIRQIIAAWRSVLEASQHLDIQLNAEQSASTLAGLAFHPVDSSDEMVLRVCRSVGITQFITDDADFSLVPGIQVFTANAEVIEAAKLQNRLLTR